MGVGGGGWEDVRFSTKMEEDGWQKKWRFSKTA